MLKKIVIFSPVLALIFSTHALAGESPDKLYNQGRFAEAEKAYAEADMDHPKDIRYRYNRGCAAYQNSDFKGAMAAFSSVLRRAEEDETRFKATYNLGNAAYKQGDFESAVAYYKQAILYNPESEDARYNLELSLKELERLKQDKSQDPDAQSQEDSGQAQDKEQPSKIDRKGGGSDRQSQEKTSEQESSQAKDQSEKDGATGSGRDTASKQQETTRTDESQAAEQEQPQDLSGDLKPLQALPQEQGEEESSAQALSAIDKKKAESLLDNIKENRSRFLRFQVPEDKRHGVASGKDW
jgi:Ca-activated chloride channel family protein